MAAAFSRLGEALLLASLVAAPWFYGSAPDVARYSLTAALLAAGAFWCASRALGREGVPPLTLPALGLPALALLQLALGASAARVWTAEALLILAAMLTALLFCSEAGRDRRRAVWIAGTVLAVCGCQAVFGAVQGSLSPHHIYGRTTGLVTLPFGSYVNHNHFAGLVEMAALLALGMSVGRARRAGSVTPGSLGLGGLALGLVATHLASQSRGGLVALAGGAVVLALLSSAERRGFRKGALVWGLVGAVSLVAVGLAAVAPRARERLATILQGPADSSGTYRIDIARATLHLAAAHPLLGSGLGAYADAVAAFKPAHGDVRTAHAESDVLEFLAEGGTLGIAAVLWLGWGIVARLRERVVNGRDPFRKAIAIGAAAGASAVLIHGLFDFNLRIPANALVFAALLGVAAAPRAEGPAPVGGRLASGSLALFLLVCGVVSAWRAEGSWALSRALAETDANQRIERLGAVLSAHPYFAEGLRARGLAWRDLGLAPGPLQGGRLARAESDLVAALRLRPRWGEAWADLGWVHALRGDGDQARQDLERAVAFDPTHPGITAARQEYLRRAERRLP